MADALEGLLGKGHYQGPAGGSVDGAEIVLGAALKNTSRRYEVWAWRSGPVASRGVSRRDTLRPSFAATMQPETEPSKRGYSLVVISI